MDVFIVIEFIPCDDPYYGYKLSVCRWVRNCTKKNLTTYVAVSLLFVI